MGSENRIETTQMGSVVVLTLYGEHDLATQQASRGVVESVARPGARLVVDASPATFVDSSVLHILIYASQNADRFAIVAPEGDPCRELVRLAGVEEALAACSSLDEALAAVMADLPNRVRTESMLDVEAHRDLVGAVGWRRAQPVDDYPRILDAEDNDRVELPNGSVVDLPAEEAIAYTVHVPVGKEVRVIGRKEGLASLSEDEREHRILDRASELATHGHHAGWLE